MWISAYKSNQGTSLTTCCSRAANALSYWRPRSSARHSAPKETAQVVKYASVLGLRWGAVSDGQHLKLYDAPVPNVTPENRLVFEVDLAGHKDREDFEVRTFPDLILLSKENMLAGEKLAERAAQEGVRELLTTPDSETVSALRDELKDRKRMHLTNAQLAEVLSDLLG
jgi:hypothetical protein